MSTELMRVEESGEVTVPPAITAGGTTSAQARVDSVSRTMDNAMNKASTLVLSPEEVAALKADFPDDAFKPGAAGKESLIYIEHAHLRDRLDSALGMGQWALLRTRPHWAEEFVTQKNEKATRIYADCCLLVRGCMVAEAIGDMVYYPNNASQNYGDAAEGAVTAAFRRCAKQFGVGLQAWKKDFGEGWWARKRGQTRQTAPPTSPAARQSVPASEPHKEAPPAPEAVQSPPVQPKLSAKAKREGFDKLLEACKSRFLSQIKPVEAAALQYFRALQAGGILENEGLADLPSVAMFPSASIDNTAEANHTALKADRDRHMAGIKAIMDGNDQLDGAEIPPDVDEPTVPEIADSVEPKSKPVPIGTESKRIRVKGCGQKGGESARGPWMRTWVQDANGTYYNTFDRTIGAKAMGLKGLDATIWFVAGEKGNDYSEIEGAL
jgi:hypothetical protein